MIGLYLMLFIMVVLSPVLVITALKQTKQDIPNDNKHDNR